MIVLSLQLAFLFSVWLAVLEFERVLCHLSIYGYSVNAKKNPARFARRSLSMGIAFLKSLRARMYVYGNIRINCWHPNKPAKILMISWER